LIEQLYELRRDRRTVSLLWSPGCYHGSVGQGWEVVERYISSQKGAADEKDL